MTDFLDIVNIGDQLFPRFLLRSRQAPLCKRMEKLSKKKGIDLADIMCGGECNQSRRKTIFPLYKSSQ